MANLKPNTSIVDTKNVQPNTLRDWTQKKYLYVCEELERTFDSIESKELKKLNLLPKITLILSEGNTNIGAMENREFNNPNDILFLLKTYQEVCAYIGLYVKFLPTIENFCMYSGITAKHYKTLLQADRTPDSIKQAMQVVDDYIIENQISAGQNGFARSDMTKFRAQTSGEHGHNLVTQKEQNDTDNNTRRLQSKDELLQQLQQLNPMLKLNDKSKDKENTNGKKT